MSKKTPETEAVVGSPRAFKPRKEALLKHNRRVWGEFKIATLAYLAGLGWSAPQIAKHPNIASTEKAVASVAYELGIELNSHTDESTQRLVVRLSTKTMGILRQQADARQTIVQDYVREILRTMTRQPWLAANIVPFPNQPTEKDDIEDAFVGSLEGEEPEEEKGPPLFPRSAYRWGKEEAA